MGKRAALLLLFIISVSVVSCIGGEDGEGVNVPPFIRAFSAIPPQGEAPLTVSFNWKILNADGDTLTCYLDVDNDGTVDYTINDCANNTSQTHTYSTAGTYTAVLTVEDGRGGQDSAEETVIVSSPLSNLKVKVLGGSGVMNRG